MSERKKSFYRRLTRGGREAFPPCPGEVGRIGFVGLSPGAGTTTLALAAVDCLAAAAKSKKPLSQRSVPAFIEISAGTGECISGGLIYDKIGMDRHFAGREFISFYRLAAEGKPVAGRANYSGGVNWALRMPGDADYPIGAAALLRLIDNIEGSPLICDISAALSRETLADVLSDMHRIVCVVDPLPSKLLAGGKVIEQVRSAEHSGIPVVFVLNKMNAGVNLREVRNFINLRDPIAAPAVDIRAVYAAEYACRSLADDPGIRKAIAEIFAAALHKTVQIS